MITRCELQDVIRTRLGTSVLEGDRVHKQDPPADIARSNQRETFQAAHCINIVDEAGNNLSTKMAIAEEQRTCPTLRQ